MSFFAIFYIFDLFKRPLFLKINHSEMTATRGGVALSFIIYCLLGYFFSQSDFFLHLQPKIIIDRITLPYSPAVSYMNRPFSFAIRDISNKIYVDPTIFTISLGVYKTTMEINQQPIITTEQKKYHICNESDVQKSDDLSVLQNSFCLDNGNFTIEGSDSEDHCTNVQLHIFRCQNSTENNNSCKSPEVIDQFFKMKNLVLIFIDSVFQPQNYESPAMTKLFATLYKLESDLNRLITIKLQKVILSTEETVIFPSKSSFNTYAYEEQKSEYGIISSSQEPIISVLLYSSGNQMNIHRSYQSLPEALAVLGGLFSFLILCGRVIISANHSLVLTTSLMNFLYSFQQPPNEKGSESFIKKMISQNLIKGPMQKEEHGINEDKFFNIDQLGKESILENSNYRENIADPKYDSGRNLGLNRSKEKPLILKLQAKNLSEDSLSESEKAENLPNPNALPDSIVNKEIELPLKKLDTSILKQRATTTNIKGLFHRMWLIKNDDKEAKLEAFSNLNDQQTRIVFSFWDLLKLSIKKILGRELNFKEKIFERAQEVFENEIDIVKILQRVQDIEKLKYLLLGEKQISLFNVLEKPMIFLQEKNNRYSTMIKGISPRKVSMKSQMNEAFAYYQELEKKGNLDKVDEKLFVMVGKRIRAFKQYFSNEQS